MGIPFSEIKLHRTDGVVNLATAAKGITVRDKVVTVDPNLLFHRMLRVKQSDEDLAGYLTYELREPPPALFDDVSLRAGTKSSLMTQLPHTELGVYPRDTPFVVDGGFLLRQIKWERDENYGDICKHYEKYLTEKYPGPKVVVFDGYDFSTTKDATHMRRGVKGTCI